MSTKTYSGKVYKLYNTEDNRYYIGSTIQKYVSNRLCTHKGDAKNNRRPDNILHKAMLQIGLDNWYIKVLLNKEVNDRRSICREEDIFIDLEDPNCLNEKRSCGIYRDEYNTDKEYEKARYANVNKDKEAARGRRKWERLKSNPEKLKQHYKKLNDKARCVAKK